MFPVMTTETPREIGVPEIVRISSPTHFQFGKNVAIVDRQYGLGCLLYVLRPALRHERDKTSRKKI